VELIPPGHCLAHSTHASTDCANKLWIDKAGRSQVKLVFDGSAVD
jgi:hypothetical protein